MDLSVNICTHNNREFLRVCLGSLGSALRRISHEIIVVDNASTDGTVEMVRMGFPAVRLIQNRANNGVARARNQAIRRSRGRCILLLDADTEVWSGDFADLLQYMADHPEVGLLGVRQVRFDDQPFAAGRTFPTLKNVLLNRLAFLACVRNSRSMREQHVTLFDQRAPIQVDYLIGAFQLIRREMFETIGLLDENMFFGFEDADFCARVEKAGCTSVYYPFFTIKHYVQQRTRRQLLTRAGVRCLLAQIRSFGRFYVKHHDVLRSRRQRSQDVATSLDGPGGLAHPAVRQGGTNPVPGDGGRDAAHRLDRAGAGSRSGSA